MNSKQLMRAISEIEDKYIIAADPTYKAAAKKFRDKKSWAHLCVPLAICLIIAASIPVIIFYGISNNNMVHTGSTMPSQSASQSQSDNIIPEQSLAGLPVNNYILSKTSDNVYKGPYKNLNSYFWSEPFPTFVVARVDSVQNDPADTTSQLSNITVLSTLYSIKESDTQSAIPPENIQVKQTNSFVDYTADPKASNFLRKGGVYILPLDLNYKTACATVLGDLNVLYEIDDNGKVWSHSDYEDLNAFDGQDAGVLITKIKDISTNDDFKLARSDFWWNLNVFSLADVTFNSKSGDNYSFTVNEILSEAPIPTSQNNQKADKSAFSSAVINQSSVELESGRRYFVFYGCKDGTVDIQDFGIAKIQDDGTIKAVFAKTPDGDTGSSIFSTYEGRSMSDMKNMLERVKPWLGTL